MWNFESELMDFLFLGIWILKHERKSSKISKLNKLKLKLEIYSACCCRTHLNLQFRTEQCAISNGFAPEFHNLLVSNSKMIVEQLWITVEWWIEQNVDYPLTFSFHVTFESEAVWWKMMDCARKMEMFLGLTFTLVMIDRLNFFHSKTDRKNHTFWTFSMTPDSQLVRFHVFCIKLFIWSRAHAK